MKIGFIGAGKVGGNLGKYFTEKGKSLSGYFSNNYDSAEKASLFTKSKCYKNLEDLVKHSDLIYITTPDDEIYNVWKTISNYNIKNKFICHASGSISSQIFCDINNSGAFGYSIHPMFAFSDKNSIYKNLNNAYFSIEGDQRHINKIKEFIDSLGNKTLIIPSKDKALYHLANVTVSNLVLSLIENGSNYLVKCGVNYEDALQALAPLIKNNINNILEKGTMNSLTGPVERNDVGTIQKHIETMPKADIELYKLLTLNLITLSEEKHKNRDYSNLKEYLGGL